MKLNQMQQIIAGVVIVGLTVLISHFLILKGDRQQILAIDAKIETLQQEINVAKIIQKTATELQDEMIHLKAQLDRLKKILPVVINQPKFLADMKRYANENGLEILDLTNTRPVASDMIEEHPFGFTAVGNYHDFGHFFAQLTSYQRIVNVKGLQLQRLNDANYSVRCYFILSVFTYREPTEEELKQQIAAKKQARKIKGKKRR